MGRSTTDILLYIYIRLEKGSGENKNLVTPVARVCTVVYHVYLMYEYLYIIIRTATETVDEYEPVHVISLQSDKLLQ